MEVSRIIDYRKIVVEVSQAILQEYRKKGYINFHLHTDASFLDGMNDIPSLIKRLKEIGHKACAITDHGVAHNLLKFYKACKENDIKPILGLEAYVAYDLTKRSKADLLALAEEKGDIFIYEGDRSHLVILAKNFEGYKNICRMTRVSNAQGFYSNPRIDYKLLEECKEGLIVINGHVGTDIAKSIERYIETGNEQDLQRAYRLNEWYKSVFGDDYYLEIQNHRLDIEYKITPYIIKMAQETGVKLVMSNDSHYTWRSDADIHRAHMANGLKKFYDEFMEGDFEGFATCDEFYVKDNDEMLEVAMEFGVYGVEALLNTHELAEKCNVKIPNIELTFDKDGKPKWKTKNYLFPDFKVPAPYNGADEYFTYLAKRGLEDRQEKGELDLERFSMNEYWERLEYEIEVIKDMGFPTYFLIVWDIIKFCHDNDIPVGPGRGSGAGSLVCYALRLTNVDPLKFGLLFERMRECARQNPVNCGEALKPYLPTHASNRHEGVANHNGMVKRVGMQQWVIRNQAA